MMASEKAEMVPFEEDQEENGNKEEQTGKKLLEPHQAFEIYSALPIANQQRLLALWRSIYEDHPIPDEWTRWKILQWAGNRWDPNYCSQGIQVFGDGLNLTSEAGDEVSLVRAIHGVKFQPTQMDGPQFSYFETKHIKGRFCIGFTAPKNPQYALFYLHDLGYYSDGEVVQLLPNARIEDNEISTIGCGLMNQMGKRKIFFTKNGELFAKPIPVPSTAANELFPVISMFSSDCRFEDSNFGLKPFQFKYKGNEEKLSQEMVFG